MGVKKKVPPLSRYYARKIVLLKREIAELRAQIRRMQANINWR